MAQTSASYYQELFDHMSREHGLTLLESEMHEIERIVARQIAKRAAQQTYTEAATNDVLMDRRKEASDGLNASTAVPCSTLVGDGAALRAEIARLIKEWRGRISDARQEAMECSRAGHSKIAAGIGSTADDYETVVETFAAALEREARRTQDATEDATEDAR